MAGIIIQIYSIPLTGIIIMDWEESSALQTKQTDPNECIQETGKHLGKLSCVEIYSPFEYVQ